MRTVVRRPCGPGDLIDIAAEYRGRWGPPLSEAPVPWEDFAPMLEFVSAGLIRSDSDWDQYVLDPGSGVALRYVLLFTAQGWVLRFGRTSPESTLDRGGSHRHMFSTSEQLYAALHGKSVRSGYIYGINESEIELD